MSIEKDDVCTCQDLTKSESLIGVILALSLFFKEWNKRCITSRQRQCNQLCKANGTDKYASQ